MAIEEVEKIPEIAGKTSLKFRELIEAVRVSDGSKAIKWTNDMDDTKVNSSTARLMLEKQTKKMVVVKRADHKTLYVQVVKANQIEKEKAERKKRSEEMKKKLKGKK